ncbi:MAG: glutaredoxin family protein [Opitutaceae bacterium]|nr:glutaredoxin family protein [Opitutaceae bacterium]
MQSLPHLYIKPGCPWCDSAMAFLDSHGVSYQKHDITQDSGAKTRMEEVSGQGKVPTLDWNGTILADFGEEELVPFLRDRKVKLEDS